MSLPALFYELQLPLPPILPPELEVLGTAVLDDDVDRIDRLLPPAAACVETVSVRADLLRTVLDIDEREQLHVCTAALAVSDLSRPGSLLVEAALTGALAVQLGASATPSGLIVATV